MTVWDSDEFMNDSCLGVVEVDIAEDVAKVPGGRIYKTWYLQVRTHPGSLRAPIRAPASACQHASSCPLRMWPYMADLLEKPACCMHAADECSGNELWKPQRKGVIARRVVSCEGCIEVECTRRTCPRTRRPSIRQMPISPCRSSGYPSTSHSDQQCSRVLEQHLWAISPLPESSWEEQ